MSVGDNSESVGDNSESDGDREFVGGRECR